jgi:hypothetical protein
MIAVIERILDDPIGKIVFSILLGLGLASLFRRACKDKQCVIIKGPSVKEMDKYYYKIDDDCFKYTPVATSCEK